MKKTLPTCCLPCNWALKSINLPILPCLSVPFPAFPFPLSLPCLLSSHKIKSLVSFILSLSLFVLKKTQRCLISLNSFSKQAIGLDPCKIPVSQHSTAYIQVFILWDGSYECCTLPILCIWSDFITQSGKTPSSDGVWSQRFLSAQTHLERDADSSRLIKPSPCGPLWKVFCLESSGVSVGDLLRVACSRWPLLSSVSIQKDAGGEKALLNTWIGINWILMCVEES